MVFNEDSKLFQLYLGGQSTYPSFPGVLLTSNLHNILSKPLATFSLNSCRNNGQQWERNQSCRNDYHQYLLSQGLYQRPPVLKSCNSADRAMDQPRSTCIVYAGWTVSLHFTIVQFPPCQRTSLHYDTII